MERYDIINFNDEYDRLKSSSYWFYLPMISRVEFIFNKIVDKYEPDIIMIPRRFFDQEILRYSHKINAWEKGFHSQENLVNFIDNKCRINKIILDDTFTLAANNKLLEIKLIYNKITDLG